MKTLLFVCVMLCLNHLSFSQIEKRVDVFDDKIWYTTPDGGWIKGTKIEDKKEVITYISFKIQTYRISSFINENTDIHSLFLLLRIAVEKFAIVNSPSRITFAEMSALSSISKFVSVQKYVEAQPEVRAFQ